MCFSVQVERDLEKLAARFNAQISKTDFQDLEKLKNWSATTEPEIVKQVMGLKRKPSTPLFKDYGEDGRIYPGSFAPVIVMENDKRVIKPMRYRVRPAQSSEEIPSQYNVFNARTDSLLVRKTWKNIFMKNHGIFPFVRFFEWVEKDGKKKLISFFPEKRDIMWAPMIFDEWHSKKDEVHFQSFALITNAPPPEVEQQGHDRCPVFLKEEDIESWLHPEKLKTNEALELLTHTEPTSFGHQF